MTKTKQRAVQLLRKYDKMKQDLRALEVELQQACHEYGREQGYIGWFHKDNLRTTLLVEEEQRLKAERLDQKADRHAWETAHG
jgi:hypothetical protein